MTNQYDNCFVSNDGVKLHCVEWGDSNKKTMILSHGYKANWSFMQRFGHNFSDEYHIISYDARGHGHSDSLDNNTSEFRVNDLQAIVENYESVNNPILFGNSMGADTVARYLEKDESNPSAAILSEPPYLHSKNNSTDSEDSCKEKLNSHQEVKSKHTEHGSWWANKIATARKQLRADRPNNYQPMDEILSDKYEIPILILRSESEEDSDKYKNNIDQNIDASVIYIDGANQMLLRDKERSVVKYVKHFLSTNEF